MESKRLIKYFIALFLISFFVINFNKIVVYTNKKLVEYELSKVAKETIKGSRDNVTSTKVETSKRNNVLEIAKIGVSAPIIFSDKSTEFVLEKALKKGIAFYPKSSPIGKKGGVSIILGHSAAPDWPNINYDKVFSKLNELEGGDMAMIYYKGGKYLYRVINKKHISPGDNGALYDFKRKTDKSYLVLITCWPPGRNVRRLEVIFVLDKTF